MSEALIHRLKESRANIWEQGKALLDKAEAEGRDLNAEEAASWQKINGDIDAVDQRVKGLEDILKRDAEMVETFARLENTPAARGIPRDEKNEQVRAFLKGESGRSLTVAADTTFRDLVKGTAAAGGNTVPTSFYGRLVEHMIDMSAILSAGPTVLETSGGETIEVPITTAHGSAAILAEGGALAENDPTFGKRSLGAYKYGDLIQIARELVDDTGVDLLGYVARQAGWAVGNAFGAHLVTGTGSSQPAGIVTNATLGVTGGTTVSGAFTADNLIDLYHSVIAPYRRSPSCAWLMRDATLASLRKLKDTTNQYLWQPGLTLGAPDTLLGKPVYTDPNVAAVALSAKSVLFGDISRYFVRLAGGVRFERSDDYAFGNDLVSFRCLVRGDGLLVDQTGAVKYFQGGAS
jgi:HK97 family phage major capsid protein